MLILVAVALIVGVVAAGVFIARRLSRADVIAPAPIVPSTGASSVPSAPATPGDAPQVTEPV